ncbi:MAG TPA: inosine/xanthosine triphosphatase [Candidatus Thermoplasmatota archaeon]|nr:inosine/xanthosine triphosphatase [Candidatus Thermoplasmatota archaeon]
MRVCMGGTFDVLHRGHRALLDAAFAAGDEGVSIGVTTDAFANARRERRVRPWEERVRDLRQFLQARGYAARGEILAIGHPYGFALEARFDAIAATEETVATAHRINEERASLHLPPLTIVLAPYILADDARPIKSTRIRNGEVDEEGRLRRPARIAVGSDNPVKLEAVKMAAMRLFGEADVRGFSVDPGVPAQPFEDATWEGARRRARLALARWPEADFGVGIEAGLFEVEAAGGVMDVQACAVVDVAGRLTYGQGPGFSYPPDVVEKLRAGRTVGEVLSDISGVEEIGKREGAVGWLSRGHVTRTQLTEPAVLMAFLPRLRSEMYGL